MKNQFKMDIFTNDIYRVAAQFRSIIDENQGNITYYSRISHPKNDIMFIRAHIPHGQHQQMLNQLAQTGRLKITQQKTDESTPTYPDHLTHINVQITDKHFYLILPNWAVALIAISASAAIAYFTWKRIAKRRRQRHQTS